MRPLLLAGLIVLAGCATQPQLVMLNPLTGATVGCPEPDPNANSGAFLVSRACLSACQAHGFRPVPGTNSTGFADSIPTACTN